MFDEDALLPISALQHLMFCERQCALIHIERLWAENRLTVEGRQLHDKAHGGQSQTRAHVRIVRALPLRSLRLGLTGVADIVEFRQAAGHVHAPLGIPFPIEYKRGRPKAHDADRVQLCAQAVCLEEMLGVSVPEGALFYGSTKRRQEVRFDATLRSIMEAASTKLHALIAEGRTPKAVREPKCQACSLAELCLPEAMEPRRSASRYVDASLRAALAALPRPSA